MHTDRHSLTHYINSKPNPGIEQRNLRTDLIGMFPAATSNGKPLPLKQRTSSLDTRRDYSHGTWWSLLVLLKAREFFITVDNFSIWRRHLAWAMENGKDLRAYMTQRYGSSMVFMSLLLSTELSILFNSAGVTTEVRKELREGNHESVSFWAGFMIIISAILTVLSLISLFTAWGMVNSIDEVNAHCIFRSSIGQYAAELPGRLIVCSIYTFLVAFMMFFFLLLPIGPWSILLLAVTVFLFVHIVTSFSALGRVIMHTGAMGKTRIFTQDYEDSLLPHSLHTNLLAKAEANLSHNASIIRQYRRKQKPIDRTIPATELYAHLSGSVDSTRVHDYTPSTRPRSDSTVRFADQPPQERHNGGNRLTPLSDISVSSVQESHAAIRSVPSLQASSLRKSTYAHPSPSQPHPFSDSDRRLSSVSNSSVEQWLRSSSNDDVGLSPRVGKSDSTPRRDLASYPQDSLSLDSRPSLRESDLSEEERFVLDYGDFQENEGLVATTSIDAPSTKRESDDITRQNRFHGIQPEPISTAIPFATDRQEEEEEKEDINDERATLLQTHGAPVGRYNSFQETNR